jgi:geranylgeranyl pyrophosphate synthase
MAVAYLASCAGRYGMIGGQIMDLEGEKKTLTLEQLLKLHSMKTGALISAASVLGALAAGVSLTDPRMQDVVTYAENIGLAFQIVDDILDCTGSAEELGKNVGVDAEHQKNTFMSFYSVKEAQYYADRLTEEAVQALKKYPDSDILCSLAKWLATRKK